MANNGNGKWAVAFWVIAVLSVGSFGWTTACYWDNQRRIDLNTTKFFALKEVSNDCLHKIDLRLSRIEQKLEIN